MRRIATKSLELLGLEGAPLTGRLILLHLLLWLLLSAYGELSWWLAPALTFPHLSLSFSPEWALLKHAPWTLISYILPHEHLLHLLVNLLVLSWVGRRAERYLGASRMLALYLYGALAGSLSYLLVYQLSSLLGWSGIIPLGLVGSSAAILTLAVVALWEAQRGYSPARRAGLLLLGAVCLLYILSGLFSSFNRGGTVAHLGAVSFALAYLLAARRGWYWSRGLEQWIERYHLLGCRSAEPSVASAAQATEPLRAEELAELEQLQRRLRYSGYPSLSGSEQQRLLELLARSRQAPEEGQRDAEA